MSQLKRSMMQLVRGYLDSGAFTHMDFEVSFPEKGSTLVEIAFIEQPAYRFRISEEVNYSLAAITSGGKGESTIATTESPGNAKTQERRAVSTVADGIERIPAWMKNLYEDLKVRDVGVREVDALQKKLEEQLQAHIQDSRSHLSPEEFSKLSAGLDALTKGFEELEAEHQITKAELQALKNEVEAIRTAAADVPKGVLARLAKSRFLRMGKTLATSEQGKKFLLDAAEKFMLGDSSGSSSS